jgi:hypothetical protein
VEGSMLGSSVKPEIVLQGLTGVSVSAKTARGHGSQHDVGFVHVAWKNW